NPQAFDAALKRRGLEPESQRLNALNGHLQAITRVLESWRARRKAASDKIYQAKSKGDLVAEENLRTEVALCKTSIATLELEQKEQSEDLKKALSEIPNLPLDDVPDGTDEHGNVQRHVFGKPRDYGFVPKAHDDLGHELGLMD